MSKIEESSSLISFNLKYLSMYLLDLRSSGIPTTTNEIPATTTNTAFHHEKLQIGDPIQDWDTAFIIMVSNLGLYDKIIGNSPLLEPAHRPELNDPRYARGTLPVEAATSNTSSTTNLQPVERITDLTDDGIKLYLLERDEADWQNRPYEEEQEKLKAVRNWISGTVSTEIMRNCYKGGKDIKNWYQLITTTAAEDPMATKQRLGLEYLDLFSRREIPKSIADAREWIKIWRLTIEKAEQAKVPGTQQCDDWIRPLLRALSGVLPVWSASYIEIHRERMRSNALKFDQVMRQVQMVLSEVPEPLPA